MAGDWMKLELETPDKPEVHSIATMLEMDPDLVVGKLIRVWQWFDKHTSDGNAFGVTFSLVDRITLITGFGEAMQFVGWLEQRDKNLVMVNFDRHNGKGAKKRALTNRRVAECREKSNAKRNAASVTKSVTREEKRINKTVQDSGESRDGQKFTEADKQLAREMLEQVREVTPSAKASPKWPDTIRLMRERDGHSLEQIRAMFAWANNDPFWRANILSPDTLRKQWPKLEAKRNTTKQSKDQPYGANAI